MNRNTMQNLERFSTKVPFLIENNMLKELMEAYNKFCTEEGIGENRSLHYMHIWGFLAGIPEKIIVGLYNTYCNREEPNDQDQMY